MDRGRMPGPCVAQQRARLHQRLVVAARHEQPQHRAQLLAREVLADPDQADRGDEDAGPGGDPEPRLLRDPGRVPPQRLDVEAPLVEQVAPQRPGLALVAKMRPGPRQRTPQRRRHALDRDQDGLVGAQHGVVEGLAVHDVAGGALQVRGFVDVDRRVAGPDPDGRVGRGISGPNHLHAAGREDHVGAVGLHELVDQREADLFEHLHRAIRRAGLHRRLGEGPGRVDAARTGRGMRADDDGVAGHQRAEHLEVHGGDRVGGRHQGEDDAGRARDRDGSGGFVVAGVDEVPVPVMIDEGDAAQLVLDALVLDDAEPRLPDRPLGIVTGLLVRHARGGIGDPLGRLPIVALEDPGRPSRPVEDHLGPGPHRHGGVAYVDELPDLRVHVAVRRYARPRPDVRAEPMTSPRARPTAVSTRRSRSSDRPWVIRMPGLNCSTRGSRAEKMAHTPFS